MMITESYEYDAPYVFISYDSADEKTVLPVIAALHNCGIKVWYKGGCKNGAPDLEYSAQRLNSCTAFISFMSQKTHDSPSCRMEINQSVSIVQEPIIVYLEEICMSLGMMMQLSSACSIDYYRMNSINELVNTIMECDGIRALMDCSNNRDRNPILSLDELREREQLFQKGKDIYESGNKYDGLSKLKEAAELGHAEACYYIANKLIKNYLRESENTESYEWYKKAAELGHAVSQKIVAENYMYGTFGEKNEQLALEWIMRAAEGGYDEAQYLSYLWLPDTEEEKRLYFLKLAADQDHYESQNCLADHYKWSEPCTKENMEMAIYWYKRAYESKKRNNTHCRFVYKHPMYSIAKIYDYEESPIYDIKKAVEYFMIAAADEYSFAYYDLGMLYLENPQMRDTKQGIEWLKKAAREDSVFAKAELRKRGIIMM